MITSLRLETSPYENLSRHWLSCARRLPWLVAALHCFWAIGLHAGAGAPDPTFAGTGAKRFRFGFGDDFANAVTVQPDGKVLVAGVSTADVLGFGRTIISIARYGTNDLLDPSFGVGGKVITPVSGNTNVNSGAQAIQVQRDGKIVVAGTLSEGTNQFAMLVRYHPDGSPDPSFGHGGVVTNFFNQGGSGNTLLIQSDGKIILGGSARNGFGSDYALARYDTNGLLDSSFGSAGVTTDGEGIQVNGLAMQVDGKIIAVGWGGNYDFAVFRYTTNGVLDSSFGPDHTGRVITHLGTFSDFSQATCVAIESGDSIQTLDRIVVGGYTDAFDPPRFEAVRYRLDGALDTSFGGSGVVTIVTGAGFFNIAKSILVQGTGLEPRKIILAGYASGNFINTFCVVRLNEDGSLDNSFDGDGRVFTSFGSDQDDGNGAALVRGGKLLVVGSTQVNENNHDFALARYYLSDGSLDRTFGADGQFLQDVEERPAQAKAVAIQPDGKIILAGSTANGIRTEFQGSTALTRLQPDGAVDIAFGHFGKATLTFGEDESAFNAMTIQPDGKILAAGFAGTNFLVARYTTNGALDTSFNGSGIATPSIAPGGNIANAIALQPDGRIVIAGVSSFSGSFAVLRFNSNGTLDPSFDGDGKVTIDFGSGLNSATAVSVQPDGKILAGGYAVIGGTTLDFALVRFRTNGSADSSFGTFGAVLTELGSGRALANAAAIQPDGKILLAGAVVVGSTIQFAVVRYDTNGLLDPSFAGDGVVITPIALVDDEATSIAVQPDGKILVGGKARIVGHLEFAVVRYNSNGALDASFGIGGKAFVDFGDAADNTLYALAIDPAGRVVVAGEAGGSFGIGRLEADTMVRLHSIERPANGHALLRGIGAPNQTYTIQASTNLIFGSFRSLGQLTTDPAGVWQYDDAGAFNSPKRFYRLATP